MTRTEFHIGIDDTDSRFRGCTTYTAAVLYQELCARGFEPYDFPWLVRLNPNIPWKTRGNGALSLHLIAEEDDIEKIRDLTLEIVGNTAELSAKRTDPAVVFLKGSVPEILQKYSTSALHNVLSIQQAKRMAKRAKVETHLLKGTRGLIGAMAAVGASLDQADHTFEIIAYRTNENRGTPRRINLESIRLMNSEHGARTFHNLDPDSGRILICPHSSDPVLLGIRGLSPYAVQEAFGQVQNYEPIERVVIFRTNQGTDAHLTRLREIVELSPHQSAILMGRVATIPRVLRGGHVVFQLSDATSSITCAAYAPTKSLMRATRELLPGDRVMVYGGVRGGNNGRLTFNLERIDVLELEENIETENPFCSSCGGRCESMGRGQGLRCKHCGLRVDRREPIRVYRMRKLERATYRAAVQARRHLTRPDIRIE